MPARRRTRRDERRRRLSQNFLRPDAAERFVREAGFSVGERVVEIGPGAGVITAALAHRGVEVVAVEFDSTWAARLSARVRTEGLANVRVVNADFRSYRLPASPFRVVGSVPFGQTTTILRRLFDDPSAPLERADLIVQWEVARKRTQDPPASLRSVAWAPWWEFRLGRRIPAGAFRPMPRVDGGVLHVSRRSPPLLPSEMASAYAGFVQRQWPFGDGSAERRPR